MFLLIGIVDWLEKNSKPCFYKEHFGFECFGCGFQRSVIELLKGNFIESIKLYPALIPMLVTFTFLVVHLKFKFTFGAKLLTILFICTISIMALNFLYKITLN